MPGGDGAAQHRAWDAVGLPAVLLNRGRRAGGSPEESGDRSRDHEGVRSPRFPLQIRSGEPGPGRRSSWGERGVPGGSAVAPRGGEGAQPALQGCSSGSMGGRGMSTAEPSTTVAAVVSTAPRSTHASRNSSRHLRGFSSWGRAEQGCKRGGGSVGRARRGSCRGVPCSAGIRGWHGTGRVRCGPQFIQLTRRRAGACPCTGSSRSGRRGSRSRSWRRRGAARRGGASGRGRGAGACPWRGSPGTCRRSSPCCRAGRRGGEEEGRGGRR